MAFTAREEPSIGAVRLLLACSALDRSDSETASALREQFEPRLQSLNSAFGLSVEVHSTGLLGSAPDCHRPGPGDDREFSEAEREELERLSVDRDVFFVALLLDTSSAIDEELARMVANALDGGLNSRYRIILDEARQSTLDIEPGLARDLPAIRLLADLTAEPFEGLVELILAAITEMVTLELPPPDPVDVDVGDLPPVVDENVQFTVYRPRAVRPGAWYPMLAFAHLAERRPDAPADEPDPIEQVKALAHQALGDQVPAYASPTSDARGAIPKEGELTFVPIMEGVEFNPPRRVFRWLEDVHKEDFRLRAVARPSGQVLRGRLTVFLGVFILADVDLVIRIDELAAPPPTPALHTLVAARAPSPGPRTTLEAANARPYRKIFPSYSHRDTEIVEQAERVGAALGDVYLRDRTTLRSGEDWNARLLELIDEADVFQLFWSTNSMRSEYVRQEWEHAVNLARPDSFIRPTYWERPMPHSDDPLLPPDSLRSLHFHSLVVADAPSPGVAPTTEPGDDVDLQHAGSMPNVDRDQSLSNVIQSREQPWREIAATRTKARWLVGLGIVVSAVGLGLAPIDACCVVLPVNWGAAGLIAAGGVLVVVGVILHVIATVRRRRVDRDLL